MSILTLILDILFLFLAIKIFSVLKFWNNLILSLLLLDF